MFASNDATKPEDRERVKDPQPREKVTMEPHFSPGFPVEGEDIQLPTTAEYEKESLRVGMSNPAVRHRRRICDWNKNELEWLVGMLSLIHI